MSANQAPVIATRNEAKSGQCIENKEIPDLTSRLQGHADQLVEMCSRISEVFCVVLREGTVPGQSPDRPCRTTDLGNSLALIDDRIDSAIQQLKSIAERCEL